MQEQLTYDFQQIGHWMENHLAKRAGMVADDITKFVDENLEKVIIWHELEKVELCEESIKEHYDDLMHFVDKGEDEIAYLLDRSAAGEMVMIDQYTGNPKKVTRRRKMSMHGTYKGLAFVALFLLIAFKMGKGIFTYVFVFIAVAYTVILARKTDRGEVSLY